MWFQQIHQPYVTPGNRAAAVVSGFNIIVFGTIALLSYKEKLAKKRNSEPISFSASTLPLASSNISREKGAAVNVTALET